MRPKPHSPPRMNRSTEGRQMKIDLYKSAINDNKFLTVPEGEKLPVVPDSELRNPVLFKTSLDPTSANELKWISGLNLMKIDSADVIHQIDAKGFGVHTPTIIGVTISEEPPLKP
jgi:hypothetical protein